jgi:hypothetical protein
MASKENGRSILRSCGSKGRIHFLASLVLWTTRESSSLFVPSKFSTKEKVMKIKRNVAQAENRNARITS